MPEHDHGRIGPATSGLEPNRYRPARRRPAGLNGTWDFHLDVGPVPSLNGAAAARPDSISVPEGPTIFDAFEQLGLKLEAREVPLPSLVIDRIDPLIEN
jgi:uncharacterized protein (TIGR03435 family)